MGLGDPHVYIGSYQEVTATFFVFCGLAGSRMGCFDTRVSILFLQVKQTCKPGGPAILHG